MKAVDMNVLVRWITRDDEEQSPIADTVMKDPVWIALTVMIELVWVLGGRRYGFDRATIVMVLWSLSDLSTATVERAPDLRWCIERYAAGADFADMVHVIASTGAAAFVTFEHDLADSAGPGAPLPIETLA